MEKFLIKNTTREQREQIVKESLGFCDISCEDGGRYGYELYEPYIDGEMEIAEITKAFRASYVSEQREGRSQGCSYVR